MLSRLIALPFVLGACIALYLTWETDESYALYIIPMALSLAVIYILQPQIDWWWYKRKPPELDLPLIRLLDQHFPFYQKLSPALKIRFRQRMVLYMLANDYIGKGFEVVPEDVKGMLAANVVMITFGQEDFLLNKFERIVVYPHPFPSPQHPRHLHACEHFEEDGVILFSAEHLIAGILQSTKYFNTGLYEYARVYQSSYPEKPYPVFDEFIWGKIEAICGFSKEGLEKYIGLPEIEALAICIALYFIYPEKVRQLMPNAYKDFCHIFNLDPMKEVNPIGKQISLEEKNPVV